MAGLATNWYNVLQGKGLEIIQVVRVSAGGGLPTPQDLAEWRAQNYASYPVVRDVTGSLARIHPMPDIVSSVIVDKHQRIRLQARPTPEELLDLLQDLLAEE